MELIFEREITGITEDLALLQKNVEQWFENGGWTMGIGSGERATSDACQP